MNSSSSQSSEESNDSSLFPYTELINIVRVTSDLDNEPFSYCDNGVRPDIRYRSNLFFQFTMFEDGAKCRVGDLVIGDGEDLSKHPTPTPKVRRSTTTSLMDIYNSYGLEVMYSHLVNLYNNAEVYYSYIYIAGSLAVIDPAYVKTLTLNANAIPDHVYAATRALISYLLLKLLYIEARQPKLLEPLTTVTITLPDDLLARIVGGRVSKSIREKYLGMIRARSLPLGAVAAVAIRPCTHLMRREYLLWIASTQAVHERSLSTSKEGEHTLVYGDAIARVGTPRPVVFSPYDYAEAHRMMKKDSLNPVRELLWNESMKSEEKLAWIVQLAHETNYEAKVTKMQGNQTQALFEQLRERFWSEFETTQATSVHQPRSDNIVASV